MSTLYLLSCIAMSVTVAHPTGVSESHENEVPSYDFTFVTRPQWGARTAKEVTPLKTPVPYVTIHHSYSPPACSGLEECSKAMQAMQNMHMDKNDWWDIGYSFAVGSDGVAYEGRGWEILGAHAKYFNTISIGICLIGDWRYSIPPAIQLKTAKALIAAGVELGYIRPDYRLVGHRQVRATECPGDALFSEIKNWHHHSNFPATPKDLLDVPEISDHVKDEIRNETKLIMLN